MKQEVNVDFIGEPVTDPNRIQTNVWNELIENKHCAALCCVRMLNFVQVIRLCNNGSVAIATDLQLVPHKHVELL